MKMTLIQAKAHLNGLQALAVPENQYLSCIHTYLRDVEWTVHQLIPANELKNHVAVAELIDLEQATGKKVEAFLTGGAYA